MILCRCFQTKKRKISENAVFGRAEVTNLFNLFTLFHFQWGESFRQRIPGRGLAPNPTKIKKFCTTKGESWEDPQMSEKRKR